MKWFRHESDASLDSKLQDILLEYGAEGYGVYWYCIEMVARNVGPSNLTFELAHDARIIARNLSLGVQRTEEIMRHMVEIGLFEISNHVVTCMKLAKRADDYTSKLVRSQVFDNKHVLQSPTNSEKDPLQDKTRQDKRTQRNIHAKTKVVRVPIQEIVNLYHEKLPNHAKVLKLTETRRGYIKQRWREDMDSLESWGKYFDYVGTSRFLTGKEPPGNGRNAPFLADLEWLTKPGNIAKVVEGKYHG